MKNFYNLPKSVQWIFSLLLFGIGLGITLPLITKSFGYLLLPVLAPILNLTSVPFFRLIGYYKYINPFVISTVQNDEQYDLHNVFTFDYLVHFKWSDKGKYVQRVLLGHYFKALLTIIERIEGGLLSPNVKIVGHSYFFNDRTAQKFGFSISKAPLFWKINSILQFIELSSLYSFSQGKLALPKFWKVKKAEISGAELIKKKEMIKALMNKVMPKDYI